MTKIALLATLLRITEDFSHNNDYKTLAHIILYSLEWLIYLFAVFFLITDFPN